MAKHNGNGHVSVNGKTNGALADIVRAPAGGVRFSGKWYKAGQRMPEKYRRQVSNYEDGEEQGDPATSLPLTAPNFGRVPLPHAMTFVGKQSTISHVYRNPDEAVVRSGGQAWKMRRDPSIMECLEARQRATALLGWHLEVEDEKDPKQKQLKDEMTKVLNRTYMFTEYRRVLLEALWYGRYAVEHRYGFDMIDGKRRTVVKGWVPINGDKLVFRFDDGSGKYRDDEVGVRVSPVYNQDDVLAGNRRLEMTDQGMAYFLEPWERSLFAIHRHIIEDGDYEDPISAGRIHGVGIRDRIYWCWYQKQETMAQLMEVIDRTGSGITIYWYPAGDHTAKAEVEDMAERQRNENTLIMPRMSGDPAMDSYGIERIEPTTGGIQAMQEIVDNFFGDQIMRYINGGTLFSKSRALGIGGGASDVQEQSFYLIVQYDSVKLEETITHEMVAPLKRFNCPWAQDIPLWFRIDTDSPDSQEKLSAAKTLWEMGAKIKTAEVMGKVGLSMPAEDDEVLQNPQMAMQPQMPGGPGMAPAGQESQPGSLEDLFGPLMQGNDGGDEPPPDGGEQGPEPQPPAGPVQYSKAAAFHRELKEALGQTDTDPSEAQREAGNYAKGKFAWNGLTISLETPAGTKRRPEWKPLAHHYGYINRTEGKDGDHVDIFIGPDLDSDLVVVVDQCTASGRFDEHKCLIGFTNVADAVDGYLANYEDGWKLGPVTAMTVEQFKAWLEDGDTTKPIEDQVSRYAKDATYGYCPECGAPGILRERRLNGNDRCENGHEYPSAIAVSRPQQYAKRQVRSSPGQKPLPGLTDANAKQHHIWREELHPREAGGQFAEKPGSGLKRQFGQGMLFHELASKLHEAEQSVDPHEKSQQKGLFDMLASADVPPEQLAALLSGDQDRMNDLRNHAHATGQAEMPSSSGSDQEGMPDSSAPGGDGFESPETPPSSVPEPSIEPSAGMPGGADQQEGEGGFSLERGKEKIGRGLGSEDKNPDTSKGQQSTMWHGMDDAEGQGKLFGGLDLAGPAEQPEQPKSLAAAFSDNEKREDEGGFDKHARETYANKIVAHLDKAMKPGQWKTSAELETGPYRKISRGAVGRDLSKLAESGALELAWDKEGMPHYALKGTELPKWLSKGDLPTVSREASEMGMTESGEDPQQAAEDAENAGEAPDATDLLKQHAQAVKAHLDAPSHETANRLGDIRRKYHELTGRGATIDADSKPYRIHRPIKEIERDIAKMQKRLDTGNANRKDAFAGGTRAQTTTFNANQGKNAESLKAYKEELREAQVAADKSSAAEPATPAAAAEDEANERGSLLKLAQAVVDSPVRMA